MPGSAGTPVLPPALRPGDTIAVVSPACPAAASLTAEVERGLAALRGLGFRVTTMPHALGRRRWTSGTIEQRLHDLHAAFADPAVHGVLYTIGGDHSAQLLPGLDLDLVAANPKVLCGYSDATVLLSAVHARTGLVTFYGPALIPQFGELPAPYPETVRHFLRVTGTPAPAGPCPVIPYQVVDLDFARREREQRPRDRSAAPPRTVLVPGTAEGPVLAACLPSLRHLTGTPWQPDTRGRLLFLEPSEPPYSPATADADLWHLSNAGLLDEVAGVVFGRPLGWSEDDRQAFHEAALDCLARLGVPVLADLEFGHTNPILTLPNGVAARLSGTEVTLLGPAVA
ncbi:S66 peptidase family protein [Streptomyces syringium]|uniref:S66 peptidase family protein n=1 Tax=Streptomyces syringium TaxID=76729 RepID=UPI003452C5BA